jgi:outer membrane lipoprotein-sorting protein
MINFSKIITLLAIAFTLSSHAQTADEILDTYFDNIGGLDKLKAVEGIKITLSLNQGGMEFPIESIQMKDGRQMTKITFQGQEIKQGVFDGTTLWSSNFMTMQAEKSDAEAFENFKLTLNDFMDEFIDYKEKGYTVEMMGKETIDGTETFKLKLTKEPLTIEGQLVDDVSYYYFDTENFIPIAVQTEIKEGPEKGMIGESTMSDYQEVDGIYFPFSMTQGIKDQMTQPLTVVNIELNPEVTDDMFAFPDSLKSDGGN